MIDLYINGLCVNYKQKDHNFILVKTCDWSCSSIYIVKYTVIHKYL